MAESVQYYLERMIPELEALEKKNIFSPVEIKSIIKKRTNFEYALQRRIKQKIDFLRSIEYEINLEDLRKKRVNRLGLQDSLKGNDLQYSGARRIYNLFRRATIKFTGDLSLWLQYIDYAKKNKANNILSSVFVQAIQYHPNNASLWIMAATWENEHNSNMAAARILLQRALRLMPENEQLWHEYFRLELIYIEKIKLRRRVLGIDQDSMEVDKEEEDEDEDENTLKLPALTGEDVAQWKEDQDEQKKIKMTEKDAAALEEANNPILQGLLAKIIYDNAINTIPNKIEFRQGFVDIYREFTDTQQHIHHVYDTIRRDMNENPDARAFLASRYLFVLDKKQEEEETGTKHHYISINDPAFVTAIRKSVQEFEVALKDLNVAHMWELYVKFLLNWFNIVSEENLKLYLNKLLLKTFKACQTNKRLSVTLYEYWTSFLMQINQEPIKIDSIATEGLKSYPQSVKLWICRVDFASNSEEQLKLYTHGLDVNAESLFLWTSYKDWIISNDTFTNEEKDQMIFRACEKATTLLPSVTTGSSDRNQIKAVLQSSYVEWAAESQGIDSARIVYKKIIKNFYPTYSFFMKCIETENQYGSAETGQEYVEYLYERITRLPDDKEGSYMSYLAYLYSQKKFQLANQVYNRAIKEILDKDAFDIRVQKLKSSHQSTL